MSLTDEIYIQLKDGLWTGLDYDGLRSKYEKSKGPFYNALQMVFDDASAEMTRLSSEMKALKEKGEKEKAKLNNLVDQQEKIAGRIKTGQQEIERLATEEQATKAKIEAIGAELQASTGLLNQAQELQKMGFDNEKLRQLSVALMEIGTKQGRKPSEAIDRFFNDLQDYDTKVGFERELQRLATITETKKLEAENWQARAERLESQYANLKEAIDTIQTLFKQRVKGEQIVSWNSIVNKLGGPDRIQEELEQYKSMSEVLDGKGKEIESRWGEEGRRG